MMVGFCFGYAAGYARRSYRLITATIIIFTLFLLQYFDQIRVIKLPWNYHQPPPAPLPDAPKKAPPPPDPEEHISLTEDVVLFVARNVIITIGIIIGYHYGTWGFSSLLTSIWILPKGKRVKY